MDVTLQKRPDAVWALLLATDQQLLNPFMFTLRSSSLHPHPFLGSKSYLFPCYTFWCVLLAKFITYARVWEKWVEMMQRNTSNLIPCSFAITHSIEKGTDFQMDFPTATQIPHRWTDCLWPSPVRVQALDVFLNKTLWFAHIWNNSEKSYTLWNGSGWMLSFTISGASTS